MNKKRAIITTYSGMSIDLADPQPEDVNIIDVAVGLSREKRWANQSRLTVTVGEHSVVGCILTDQDNKLGFLLHEGAEAYMRDVPSPIKDLCPEYSRYEERLRDVIMFKWGCKWNEVHEAMDMKLRAMEFAFLCHKPGHENFMDYSALFKLYDERMVFDIYMNWFKRLTK